MKLQKIAIRFFKYLTLSILVFVFPFNSAVAWKVRNFAQDGIGIKCGNCGFIAKDHYPFGFGGEINCPANTNECSTTTGRGSQPVQITMYWPKTFGCKEIPFGNLLPPDGVMEIYQEAYWIYPSEDTSDSRKAIKTPSQKPSLLCPQSY